MGKRRIIVIVPAYNESGRIGKVIRSIPKTIATDQETFETKIVVVNDGSQDKTDREAKAAGAIVINHLVNCGAGAATRTGLHYIMQYGHAAYVVALDADGQHAPSDIKALLQEALRTNADMVVGNRLHTGNKERMPLHRKIGNWGLTTFSRLLFGIKIADTQTGFRLFKADILPQIADYTIDRYGFATEMLWLATKRHLIIKEIPISVIYSTETLQRGQNPWGGVDLIMSLVWLKVSR